MSIILLFRFSVTSAVFSNANRHQTFDTFRTPISEAQGLRQWGALLTSIVLLEIKIGPVQRGVCKLARCISFEWFVSLFCWGNLEG